MKPIAIHDNNIGFTNRWIEYCERHSIPFIKVNCYESDIIESLRHCSALMWHWNYANYKDSIFARQFLISIEGLNIRIFPDFWTTILFDDKLGQKYLFESYNIPIPKTDVFYEKDKAVTWARNAEYPVVFKLRCGAGSQNVQLVRSFSKAKTLINKSFSSGFNYINKKQILKDRFLKFLKFKSPASFMDFGKSAYRFVIPEYDGKFIQKEAGYVMFQEFLPENTFDIRLIVLGNRCFGIRRFNRKNDFRASGSGMIDYDHTQIDKRAVQTSFDVAKKLGTRLIALDFIFDQQHIPVVTEMSYGFTVEAYDSCPGYWDAELHWHEGKQNLQYLMMEDLVSEIQNEGH